MSTINTNGINVNYPVPGVNNSSQGFRDNFTSIKNNLNIAYDEITDLQNKAIVKSPLSGIAINNDMGNTLISNALVRGFRATTYNLGNSISGITTVDLSKGDVHYGSVSANSTVNLQFVNWAPAGTQSNVQVYLTFLDANTSVYLPNSVGSAIDSSAEFIENYDAGNVRIVSTGLDEIKLRFSTVDCGKTITVEPINKSKLEKNFSTPVVKNFVLTGTITTIEGSNTVSGNGTAFLTEVDSGTTLIDGTNTIIGIVSAISSDTDLVLTEETPTIVSDLPFGKQVPIGSPVDKPGHIKVDNNYLYVCNDEYDGETSIWKRIELTKY